MKKAFLSSIAFFSLLALLTCVVDTYSETYPIALYVFYGFTIGGITFMLFFISTQFSVQKNSVIDYIEKHGNPIPVIFMILSSACISIIGHLLMKDTPYSVVGYFSGYIIIIFWYDDKCTN